MDVVAFAEAILRLHEHGVGLALLNADLVVNWGRRSEVLTAEDVVELAELARKYPTGGGVVLEMAWRLYGKNRKGAERVGDAC
ncbi:MAG: hypothetical protein AB1426_12405 [Bacillota bacterium]